MSPPHSAEGSGQAPSAEPVLSQPKDSGQVLSAQELAALRGAQLEAEEMALRARLAQVALRRLLLALEEAHGLALTEAEVDLRTGRITTPPAAADTLAPSPASGVWRNADSSRSLP